METPILAPLGAAAATALLVACGNAGTATGRDVPRPAERPTHVILVSVDTLSRSALRAFSPQAPGLPNLDRFLSGSARFENAHTTAPWTLPAHGSLLTGLYPDRHGATDPRRRLSDDTRTLAEALKEAGYETVAFTDGGYVDRRFGFSSGFDRYDEWVRDEAYGARLRLPRGGKAVSVADELPFERAVSFLEQRGSGGPPLFLFLHTYAIHSYYGRPMPWTRGLFMQGIPDGDYYRRCVQGLLGCSGEDWRRLRAMYDAGLPRLGRGFERLLSALARLRMLGSAAVILVSDHGEGFDHVRGRIHHGGRLHEDLIRIPMAVSGPGVKPGPVRSRVSLVDVMPTVLEWLRIPAPRDLDGRSLLPELRGGSGEDGRAVYAMEFFYWWAQGARDSAGQVRDKALSRAVIDNRYWYIRGRSEEALFEMASDPGQTRNLVEDKAKLLAMRRLLRERQERLTGGQARRADPELEEQLRSMGYIQ